MKIFRFMRFPYLTPGADRCACQPVPAMARFIKKPPNAEGLPNSNHAPMGSQIRRIVSSQIRKDRLVASATSAAAEAATFTRCLGLGLIDCHRAAAVFKSVKSADRL